MLDFRNTNTLWASVVVETLVRMGLTTAVISPGSRSTPLTVAFATHPQLSAIPILDERSASFFALGHAKAQGRATVLVCTSGTAGANYFPAVIEAHESQVPLLVFTADRPPELRDCASGQTIDQQRLFGDYVNYYADLALPEADQRQLCYLRQRIAQAWQQCHYPVPGPVHLNSPFRDPLAPLADNTATPLAAAINEGFFQHLDAAADARLSITLGNLPVSLGQSERGLIIAGPSQPHDPQAYCNAIATLSQGLGWPVLADGLSPLRNWARYSPHLITTYDALLRHRHHADALIPEQVIQIGPLPTSKILRQWLAQVQCRRWIITAGGRNQDPLHGMTLHLPIALETLGVKLTQKAIAPTAYCDAWRTRDKTARQRLAHHMEELPQLFESKLSWLLPTLLPPGMPLMIANSMPVRDVEWFWPLNNQGIRPYFNRGANGIDGTLSTALGIAHHHGRAVLLTGDLALLHDSNGFLNGAYRTGHLTVLLVNNQGGGIFETLPIAKFESLFERFFATPQHMDFGQLAAAHGIDHQLITSWAMLATALSQMPETGIRVLELGSDRPHDAQHRATLLATLGDFDISG